MRWNGGTLLAAAGWFPFILLPLSCTVDSTQACMCVYAACLLACVLQYMSLCSLVGELDWLGISFYLAIDL